jgi:hypothetical protein
VALLGKKGQIQVDTAVVPAVAVQLSLRPEKKGQTAGRLRFRPPGVGSKLGFGLGWGPVRRRTALERRQSSIREANPGMETEMWKIGEPGWPEARMAEQSVQGSTLVGVAPRF